MDCEYSNCKHGDLCHIKCPEKRYIHDIPIVPGEVGTGKYGLCNTVPPAIKESKGVIVYGHGVFTVGKDDFNQAFLSLVEIEKLCQREYFKRVNQE